MMIMSRSEIRKMNYYQRLQWYEMEKREIMIDKSLTQLERVQALESLARKWII